MGTPRPGARGRWRAGPPPRRAGRLAAAGAAAIAVARLSGQPVAVEGAARVLLLRHRDLVQGAEAGLLVIGRRAVGRRARAGRRGWWRARRRAGGGRRPMAWGVRGERLLHGLLEQGLQVGRGARGLG